MLLSALDVCVFISYINLRFRKPPSVSEIFNMLECIAKNIARMLVREGYCDPEDEEIVSYGLNASVEITANITTTALIGLMTGLFFETMFFLTLFSLLRSYAGGYHIESAGGCFVASCALIALLPIISLYLPEKIMLLSSIVIMLICVPVVLKLAPVPALHKPLDSKEFFHYRKHIRVRLCIISLAFILLVVLRLSHWSFILSEAVALVVLLMLAGIYKNKRSLRHRLKVIDCTKT